MKKLLLLLLAFNLNAQTLRYQDAGYFSNVSRAVIIGQEAGSKFGQNSDVDKITVPEDVTDIGGVYIPPTADRTHNIASTSIQDVGALLSTGAVDTYSTTTHIFTDASADFVTDTVSVGDIFLDDTSQDHSVVISVTNLTTLVLEPLHHSSPSIVGNTYRIVDRTGTGAAVLHIKQGGQKAGARYSEFIIMNGTTNVATVNAYYRITRMHVHGVGSNGEAVGDISATAQTDLTITAKVVNGNGSTQMAFIHVPRGKTLFLYDWYVTMHRAGVASDAMAEVQLVSELWRENSDGRVLWSTLGASVQGGKAQVDFKSPLRFRQDEDIWIRVEDVSDDNSIISAGFNYIIVDNNYL